MPADQPRTLLARFSPDRIAVDGITAGGTNGVVLWWDTLSGRIYTVYGTTNLLNPVWSNLYRVSGDGGQRSFTNGMKGGLGFYRLGVEMQP